MEEKERNTGYTNLLRNQILGESYYKYDHQGYILNQHIFMVLVQSAVPFESCLRLAMHKRTLEGNI